MPATPPSEIDKSIDEMSEKLINAAKELYFKHIKNKNIKKTKTGLPVYECINKINGLECKGLGANKKGTGLVLQKGDRCFGCQFDGVPWLRTQEGSSSNSTQFLSPVRSPSSPRHHRSASFCASPTSPTFTEESEVDPYMFARPNFLKRNGAILRARKEENNEEDLLMLKDLSDRLTIQITRPDSETSTLDKGKGKEKEVEEIEVISDSSQELINSPLTPRTLMGGLSDRIKNELAEILEEVFQRIIDVKEEREIEKTRSRLETLLIENQKLKDDNEHLTQRVKELERKVDLYEVKETIEVFKRESGIKGSIDEQDIYLMYEDMISLQIDLEDKKEQDEFVAEIEVLPHAGSKK